MVTELILKAFAGLLTFLVGLLPGWTLPSWLVTTTTTITEALANVGELSHYLAVGVLAQCLVALLAVNGIAFAIRFGRIGLSTFTGGGGSAG